MEHQEEGNSGSWIYTVLFFLIIITALAFHHEDEKFNILKSTLYIYTNRLDSLIEEENDR